MNLQCIVCLELYTSQDEIIVTPCGHLFHNVCLTNWLQRQNNCAQCRAACDSANLNRVFLNSALDNDVHLAQSCNVDIISKELEETNTNLQIVQQDLHNSNSKIMELETIIASFEDLKIKNMEAEQLQQEQLNLAIAKLQSLEEELQKSNDANAELKMIGFVMNEAPPTTPTTPCESDSNVNLLEQELELVKLEKQVVENELKKAKEELSQMKCVTQALALQNLSTFNLNAAQNHMMGQNNHQWNNTRNEPWNNTRNEPTRNSSGNMLQQSSNRNERTSRQMNRNTQESNNNENDLQNPTNRNQHNKSRQRYPHHKKNSKNDKQNNNLKDTKSNGIENDEKGSKIQSLDAPWW